MPGGNACMHAASEQASKPKTFSPFVLWSRVAESRVNNSGKGANSPFARRSRSSPHLSLFTTSLTVHHNPHCSPQTLTPCSPSEEVSKARLNKIRGVEHHERLDEQLYHDYETEEQRKVRAGLGLRTKSLLGFRCASRQRGTGSCVSAARQRHLKPGTGK